MSTTPNTNAGDPGPPSNVLLLAGRGDGRESVACGELVGATAPEQTHLLLVTGLESPRERLAAWDDAVDRRPAETTVVDVSATARSTAAADAGPDTATAWPQATVETVPGDDLLELGRTLTDALAGSDRETVLCVHSVSDLLQSAGRERVFRFLEVLTRDVERTDAVAHYHLNPDVHDGETVRTLEVLFDTVVDLRDDGHGGH